MKKSLEIKTAEALSRTKSWARGKEVSWPSESCGLKEKPVIRDFQGALKLDEFQQIQTRNPDFIFKNEKPHQKNWG